MSNLNDWPKLTIKINRHEINRRYALTPASYKKTAKRNIVRHPANLSNILDIIYISFLYNFSLSLLLLFFPTLLLLSYFYHHYPYYCCYLCYYPYYHYYYYY